MQNKIVLKHAKNWLILHILIGIILAPIGVGLVIIVWTIFRYSTESLTLHDNSILVKRGVINRNANEIPCSKINNINTYSHLLGLIFGYGNIGIYSANASEPEVFKNINNPNKVKDAIKHRMDTLEQATVPVKASTPLHKWE